MEKTKQNRFSRVLVLLLAIAMVLTMMPNGMWSAETAWADSSGAEASGLKSTKMYVDDQLYDGEASITVKQGTSHTITAYITDDEWKDYKDCSFSTDHAAELGVDTTAADVTYGYGASLTFAPTRVGEYAVKINAKEGTVKTFKIKVIPNDLRDSVDGPLQFYATSEWGESSMLGNNWYAGNELKADLNDTPEILRPQYKYLSAYTTAPEGKQYQDMQVNWYYSDTYNKNGEGYRKVPTGGKESGSIGNLIYYNGKGWYEGTYFFNIYPDTSSSGTFYYYVEISDGEHTISSVSNQAVVQIGIPTGALSGTGDSVLDYFKSAGYEYSMLGNQWSGSKPLKAEKGASSSELAAEYKYLSACTTIPADSDLKDMSVKWYYGSQYSATGAGYKEVIVPAATDGNKKENGNVGNVYYQNSKIEENWGDYYNFQLTPDTSKTGTYYYYAVITYGEHTLSSVGCQAVIEVENPQPTTPPSGNVKVSFSLQGFGSLPGMTASDITISNGSTAADLCKAQLSANGYTYDWTTALGGYLASITKNGVTLGEFTEGPLSGWMYKVNGTAPEVGMASYKLSEGDNVTVYYVADYTKDGSASKWNTNATTVTTSGVPGSAVTTSSTEVKVKEKANADGTKTKVAEVTVSSDNQKEILKQSKENKSKEIILNVTAKAAQDAEKAELTLDKSFIDSIVKETDAKLTVKSPFGDKTYTQEELKALSVAATGSTVTIAVEEAAEEPEVDVKALTAKLTPAARSAKTVKKNVKVTVNMDKQDKEILSQLTEAGYTVKYCFYRSTKKSAGYKSTVTKKTTTYTNISGKKGTKYFYKVQVRVYDETGKLIAKTALKQGKYASRTWSKK